MRFVIQAKNMLRIYDICDSIQDILEERCLGQKNEGMVGIEGEVGLVDEVMIKIMSDGREDVSISQAVSKIISDQLVLRSYRAVCSVVSV